jgi:uncharacterized membrane protein YedE/YeeE
MQIDWAHFTPLSGLAGGVLIGAAASACALVLGRAAGVSGVIAGLVPPHRAEAGWRLAFILGLLAAFPLAGLLGLSAAPRFLDGKASLALAGLCVGFGARLGGGCTSGHGVCGLSRLSLRSLVATCVFMIAAFAVVFAQRHLSN